MDRRQFLQTAGALATLQTAHAADRAVTIVLDPAAHHPCLAWALSDLQTALADHAITTRVVDRLAGAPPAGLTILAALSGSPAAATVLRQTATTVSPNPESLAIAASKLDGRAVTLATAPGPRGLMYALLELAARVRYSTDPLAALAPRTPLAEAPANSIRSVSRLFTSDVEDKPWFYDRDMWPRYFAMLAAQRFNRFHLAFGIGYDFLRNVTDAYFLFPYPFLLAVPGHNVRVPQLADAERDRNLATLRYITDQAAAHGLDFQLGLWMHGYEWIDSPHPNYTIEGLTHETHGPYCRDAVRTLLQALPSVTGVTFRIHGESGVQEGSYDFWKALFHGVATCGRTVDLDMHAKGMHQAMIDLALDTGLPVKISPKFWAEHLGMPYHQTEIRDVERPRPGRKGSALMSISDGSASYMRYGYGDLLREDRKYAVLHRIWPGTQRLLLWGDPVFAAAYSRAFSFCGSAGVDIMEPLSFKGRRGSGIAGDRCAYADASLRPHWDWEKYVHGHRIWGRLLYNPDAAPEVWQRPLAADFGAAAPQLGNALAAASRILPIVTTTHLPSAANNSYWPEIYTNQSLVDAAHPGAYTDTTPPRVFGNASPLDPQLFSRIDEFAGELLTGERTGKYSPVEVAQWLEDHADTATRELAAANARAGAKNSAAFRRAVIDIELQAGLGRFFAAKFRSALLYRIFDRTKNRAALDASVQQYRAARAAWAGLADRAKGVYMPDITVGEQRHLRGHWLDRLAAIDADIAAVAAKADAATAAEADAHVAALISEAQSRPQPRTVTCAHKQPARFRRNEPLAIAATVEGTPSAVTLYYRHVDQAERFESVAMQHANGTHTAAIPAAYTDSRYPLQYYFEVKFAGHTALYPGFNAAHANQPYFVVRSRG